MWDIDVDKIETILITYLKYVFMFWVYVLDKLILSLDILWEISSLIISCCLVNIWVELSELVLKINIVLPTSAVHLESVDQWAVSIICW